MNKISIASFAAGIISLAASIWGYIQYQIQVSPEMMAYISLSDFPLSKMIVTSFLSSNQVDANFYLTLFAIFLILGIILIAVGIIFARKK